MKKCLSTDSATNAPQSAYAAPEPLMTIRGSADALDVSTRTVSRLIAAGTLPAVRIGRLVRIRPEDLATLVKPR